MDLEKLLKSAQESSETTSSDVVAKGAALSKTVKVFLQTRGLIASTEQMNGTVPMSSAVGMESIQGLMDGSLDDLLDEANIPSENRGAALAEIALVLGRAATAGGNSAQLISDHLSMHTEDDAVSDSIIGFEQILPASVQGAYSVGTEMFGVTTDKLEADLTTSITVALLKWHGTIAPRMLPTITSSNPIVKYRREDQVIYDMADPENKLTSVLSLYDDPDMVSNELKPIILDATKDDIDVDDLLPMNKTINLFENVDTSVWGQSTFNRTDLIADGVVLEYVQISVAGKDSGGGDVTENYNIAIPNGRGRLTHARNQLSTYRAVTSSHTAVLGADAKTVVNSAPGATGTNDVLAALLNAGDRFAIDLRLTVSLDISSADAEAYGVASYRILNADGADVTQSYIDNGTDMPTVGIVGVHLDARYSEENYRKSSIVSTQQVRSLVYEVPPGRAYSANRSYSASSTGSDKDQQISNLRRLAAIGQDNVALKTIEGFLAAVTNANAAHEADPKNNPAPGAYYAAGGIVNPFSQVYELDLGHLTMFDDARLGDALHTRVATTFNMAVSDLLTVSKMRQQMAPGSKLVFRAICSGEILSKVVGYGAKSVEASEGVEYAMELDGGAIIEFITTTFKSIGNDIIMVPYIKGAPSSILNFAHNRSCGSIVAAFDVTQDTSAYRRMTASVREIPIPTNIVGVRITVTNLDKATLQA